MWGPFLGSLMPEKEPSEVTLSIKIDRHSETKINKYGERGSPSRRPFPGVNAGSGLPLISTRMEQEEIHS